MSRNVSRLAGTVACVAALLLPVACSSNVEGFDSSSSGSSKEVRLVQQPWEDLIVENKIASQVLEKLGYRTKIQELSVPLGAQALASGQADAYLGNWWPSQQTAFQQHLDSGKVQVASTIVRGTSFSPAVPRYVAEQHGVRSLADLSRKAGLFGNRILGIEPGSPGNEYIQNAIKDNAYQLGSWKLTESSTAAMLAEVERAVQQRKPVAFLAWKPHWMNVQWDLVYLDDPQGVWPGAGEIRTLTRKDYAKDNPDVARFLSQIRVDRDTASQWIHQLSKKKVPAETIAKQWISDNAGTVGKWLDGVRDANGKPARIS